MDSVPGGSNFEEACLSRWTLVSFYRSCSANNHGKKMAFLFEKVQDTLKIAELTSESKSLLRKMFDVYRKKMQDHHNNIERCKAANRNWFDAYVIFPVPMRSLDKGSGGRPSKDFEECTERTKRHRTQEIRDQYCPSELAYAAQMEYRAQGDINKSKLIKKVSTGDEQSNIKEHGTISPDKALSLLIEANLTKHQYNVIRKAALDMNCHLYPNYEAVTQAKKDCYPSGILCTESKAEVPLQNLLNKTTERLILSINEVISSLNHDKKHDLNLIWKWGCDGSGSHSQYKQMFEDPNATDEYMMVTSIVPIRLVSSNNFLVWQNPRPSSPRYCRPLRLQMAHETTALSKAEAENVQGQINQMLPTNSGGCWSVKHSLKLTMVDGKMINALTDTTSAMRCYICQATSKDFNNLKLCLGKSTKDDNLEYGISSLHAWIRLAECILHLGYRMKIARWQVRGKENQALLAAEKKRIQKEFEALGLHVDKPRQGGGTSTDGNTARSLFLYADEVANITGVHVNIIKRFRTILRVLSSGFNIKIEAFKKFCHMTAAYFVHSYPWFPMPTTVHKILMHGSLIIEHVGVSIGLLSEDAQESRNKDIRNYRENFSRKFSRTMAMEDTFNRLMVSSDPYITGLRSLVSKKASQAFSQDEIYLLNEHF